MTITQQKTEDDGRSSTLGAIVVLAALTEIRPLMPSGTVIGSEPDAALARPDGPLDSLGIVNLIVAVENHAMRVLGRETGLMSALGLSLDEGPFRSVETLTTWVNERGGEGT
jgi:hypothetical protein